ncbi:MAG: chromate resistance protein [Acidobacteriia bacterium]|nr:chromate resistance protein [Terriglobia bacterium]
MRWITRENVKVDRVACPWLIKRFIDSSAEFIFCPEDRIVDRASELQATPFDVPKNPAIKLNHRDGKCSFETILEEFHLTGNPALARLALIVHGADIPSEMHVAPESAGLYAIANGFSKTCTSDDERLEKQFPVYDALYEFCKK